MWEKKKWVHGYQARDEYSTTAAGKRSKTCLPILSCVCSRVLSHCAALFCLLAAPLSLCITCHSANGRRACLSACMCVLNLSLSVLWRLCAYRFGWSLLVAHVCRVSVSVCLHIHAHVCVRVRGRCSPGGAVAQRSHTHIALRKINQHFIYPFASWICLHPPNPHPHPNPP